MPWVKQTKLFYLLLFILLFIATRIPMLGLEAINPDAVNWHFRSEQFVVGLKSLDFAKTYQHYHPGVTLMWIMGPVIEFIRQVNPDYRVYTSDNFLLLHTYAKAALVFVQFILSLVLIWVLSKLTTFKKAFFAVMLLSFEPFFIGNSRLLHLDVLLSLLLLIGLSLTFWNLKNPRILKVFAAGLFLGLAFLTKSIAIGAVLFSFGITLVYFLLDKSYKKAILFSLMLLLFSAGTIFVLFPSIWVQPVFTITEIFSEGERVGIRKGHGQIFFGEYTRDPGILFYMWVILLKSSPLLLLGVVLYILDLVLNIKSKLKFKVSDFTKIYSEDKFILFLTIFYIGYILVMSYPTKKIDRYMIVLFPYLAVVSVWGFYKFKVYFSKIYTKVLLVLLIVLFLVLPFFSFFPYHFTYFSPLFINAQNADNVVAQKPFGIGIVQLKDFIINKYGEKDLGFYDIKPMERIYPNSKVFDIRVAGTSDYDLIILGPDEQLPEDIAQGKTRFVKDSVMKINGLDFWSIYVKQN